MTELKKDRVERAIEHLTAKDRARERLESYRHAVNDSKYCRSRIETLREQMTSYNHAIGATSAGWTGEYVTETVIGKKIEGQPKPTPSDVSIPVMRIPRTLHGTRDPKGGEKYLAALITQIMEYEKRIERNTKLCQTIESEIDAFCDPEQALALKYRFIEGLTYEAIAQQMNFSERQAYRLIDDALEHFSVKA